MSDLDVFAAHALTGLLSQVESSESGYPCRCWRGDADDRADLAARAYAIAEAMLAQRKVIAADKCNVTDNQGNAYDLFADDEAGMAFCTKPQQNDDGSGHLTIVDIPSTPKSDESSD